MIFLEDETYRYRSNFVFTQLSVIFPKEESQKFDVSHSGTVLLITVIFFKIDPASFTPINSC